MSFKRLPKWSIVLGGILLVLVGSMWLASRFTAGGNGPAAEVDVVAHQWWGEFDYPKQGVKVADVLHVPEGRPLRLVLTSDDVLHSFWLPSMRLAVDVVPGQKRTVVLNLKNAETLNGSCGAGCGCDTMQKETHSVYAAPGSPRKKPANHERRSFLPPACDNGA